MINRLLNVSSLLVLLSDLGDAASSETSQRLDPFEYLFTRLDVAAAYSV